MKMKKMFVLFVLAFLAILAIPETAAAQQNWYQAQQEAACAQDPHCARYLYHQQMRRIGVDTRGGLYNPYSWQSRTINGYGQMLQYPYQGQYMGSLGRIVQGAGGNPYFDALVVPCQVAEKSQRLQKGIAIAAIGTVTGAIIGETKGHAGKGALYGAVAGTGVALLNNSRYCSAPQGGVQLPVQPNGQPMYQQGGAPVPNQGQMPAPTPAPTPTPIAGPAVNGSGEGEFELSNSTPFRLDVYYDGKFIGRMGRPGIDSGAGPMHVAYPEMGKVYTANMIVPNEDGGVTPRAAKKVPGDAGLTFADPTSARR